MAKRPAADPAIVLRPADKTPAPCKVCGAPAPLFGVTDFSRSCEEARGKVLPVSGLPVYYRRCRKCGLLFTDAFDDWSDADFETHIYNPRYGEVDPDWERARPAGNARIVGDNFGASRQGLRVLDYGGGNGHFAQQLRLAGFPVADTYDPFHPKHRLRPHGRYNLVTCFETLEHMPDPKAGARDIASFLEDGGLVLISTLVQPADLEKQRMGWWYIGPRNGHITLFSREALAKLWGDLGFQVASFSEDLHAVFRQVPPFAAHLLLS